MAENQLSEIGNEPENNKNINPKPLNDAEIELVEVDFDTFDTFFFYSIHIIKKWMFIFPLFFDFFDLQRVKGFITNGINAFKSQEFGISKKIIFIILMIPVGLVLLVYGLLLLVVLLLLAILGYFTIIFFIDLPFWITITIQSVLLYLLICFPIDVTEQELSAAFLVTVLWWIQFLWIILFTFVLIQEIDDAMNSVIYITCYYNNKKLKSRNHFYFYSIVSCLPQMVQLLIAFICASYASELIFNNADYLSPFLHFSGLFVILKIDSFIMGVLRASYLYQPTSDFFENIEKFEMEEFEKKETNALRNFEIEKDLKREQLKKNFQEKAKNEEITEEKYAKMTEEIIDTEVKMDEKLIHEKVYGWYRIHFPSSSFIVKFFNNVNNLINPNHFFIRNLKPDDPNLKDLLSLKYFLFGLGIFIIWAHLLKICLTLACTCTTT